MRQFVTIFFAFFFSGEILCAQSYTLEGKVVDAHQQPVDAVSCVLQHATDGSFVKNVLSDENGEFFFEDLSNGIYTLYLNHMNYELREIAIEINNQNRTFEEPCTLWQKNNMIDEIVVTAERPTVKMVDQKLVYDVATSKDNNIISNAYDLLHHLPNMTGGGDDLKLVGTSDYAILIDGKPSTLTKEQMIHTLKGMSASRVEHVEIMYSAPPQYNVRGAAINLVLKNNSQPPETPPLQGEAAAEYNQGHYPGYGIRANLFYNKPSYKVDLTVGAKTLKEWYRHKMDAAHLFQDNLYDITQDDHKIYNFYDLDVRLNVLRTLKAGGKVSLTYTGNLNRRVGYQSSNTLFIENQEIYTPINSRVEKEMNTDIHNIRLDYTSAKHLSLGIDYTLYHDPTKEVYKEFEAQYPDPLMEYRTKTKQNINKVLVYLNHSLNLGKDWTLSYGMKVNYSNNHK